VKLDMTLAELKLMRSWCVCDSWKEPLLKRLAERVEDAIARLEEIERLRERIRILGGEKGDII
jgi:hypothetical protein